MQKRAKLEFETIGIPGLGHAGVCTRLSDDEATIRLAEGCPLFSGHQWVLRAGITGCPNDSRNRHIYFDSTSTLAHR